MPEETISPQQELERLFMHTGLQAEEAASFSALWTRELELKRHDFLIQKGQVERNLYYIHSGALRIFYATDDEEICVGFAYPGTLIASIPSFIQGKPSEYYIQALRKCSLRGIPRHDFYAFMEGSPVFERFWRQEIEKALIGRIEREIDLLLPSPEERLQRLLNRSPHIFQLVPQKYIASYLRMKPETLSRLHNKS